MIFQMRAENVLFLGNIKTQHLTVATKTCITYNPLPKMNWKKTNKLVEKQ